MTASQPSTDSAQRISVQHVSFSWRKIAVPVAVGLAYFIAGRLALLMAIPPGYATAVWPAAGIALACTLAFGYRVAFGIALGSFFVNIGTSFDGSGALAIARSIGVAFSLGVGAALQSIAGAWCVRRFAGYPNRVEHDRDIFALLALGGPVACCIAATWGVSTLVLSGIVPANQFGFSWLTWWVGDTIGAVIFAPLTLMLFGEPRVVWRTRRVSVAPALILGFVAVTSLFVKASEWESRRLQSKFAERAQHLAHLLERRLEQYIEVVASAASLLDAQPSLSREAFSVFASRPLARHPGILALSWAPRIRDEERAAFERRAQAELGTFRITERSVRGPLIGAPRRDEYLPVYYIEPRGTEAQALGFDLASEHSRRETLQLARDSGSPRATPPLVLVQDQHGRAAFLVVAPVFASGVAIDTAEQRRASLRGFTTAVFRAEITIERALEALNRDGIILRIVDRAAGADGVLYDDAPGAVTNGATQRTTIAVAGRDWEMQTTPTAAFLENQRGWQAWIVLAGGLLFVGLFGTVLLLVTGSEARLRGLNEELETRVGERTSALRQMVKERDVLLQEVHHRVKNNLQIVSSMLNMQIRKLEAGANRDALRECQNRVLTIAFIHESLYHSGDYARIPFAPYVRQLANSLLHASAVSAVVRLQLDIDEVSLTVDKAIPLGLLLNELITNALKHALGSVEKPMLHVSLKETPQGRFCLLVRDNGRGLPAGFDLHATISLGLQLVCTFANQLGGEVRAYNEAGAVFELMFPNEPIG